MALDFDDEILQDFLVEAGEILEQLQVQLVDLERNPTDNDLLNAIFRGFHTVKGGAGFLSLGPMVEICHGAENLFDLLRNGQLSVNAELMDVVLEVLDDVNSMFAGIQEGIEPEVINHELIATMERITSGEPAAAEPVAAAPVATPEPVVAAAPEPAATTVCPVTGDISTLSQQDYQAMLGALSDAPSSSGGDDEINDDEFESLLDELHGKGQFKQPVNTAAASSASSDEINDDEFESLLDDLHGKGQFNAAGNNSAPAPSASSNSDEINDEEFESLLDELHGKGQFKQPVTTSAPSSNSDDINDAEFESLLDELHGKGQFNVASTAAPKPAAPAPVAPAATPAVQQPTPTATAIAAMNESAVRAPTPPSAAAAGKRPAAAPAGETTVRVDTARLDEIMNMVGELVLVRNRLLSLGIDCEDEDMSKALASLDMVTGNLQGGVMKTRMQPIKKVFGRFPRVVRDLARTLKKEITLEMQGEETDLDKNLVEALADPLVHLVRNSVDHGIEMPDVREAAGKERMGVITLSAAQEGDHILLCIRDDGGGMNPELLKKLAISRGVLDQDAAQRMSDKEAYSLIFAPGFSTKTEISDISGRGVGMDVVKTRIEQLNGSINIDSGLGTGTVLEIKVPLTLAIMPTMMVKIQEQIFAFPLSCVSEIFLMDLQRTNMVDGQLSITVRDHAIPLFYLDTWLCNGPWRTQRQGEGHVVIVQIAHTQVAFVVDGLIGQEEVVIKPLGALLGGVPGMAGSTITSNGGIALILDIPGLLKQYAGRH
ncbi:MAG: chemotaxis protein CheA [Ferrimonas sp.]